MQMFAQPSRTLMGRLCKNTVASSFERRLTASPPSTSAAGREGVHLSSLESPAVWSERDHGARVKSRGAAWSQEPAPNFALGCHSSRVQQPIGKLISFDSI